MSRTARNLIQAFKSSGCSECGVRYPTVGWGGLHCDHIDPRDKRRFGAVASGNGVSGRSGSMSTQELLQELLVCQVLCTRCHLRKTKGNGNGHIEQLALFNGSGTWRYGASR